jgi:two-component system, chemotaxis family, sensor kinase CheA
MDNFELEIKQDFLNEVSINLEEVESSFMELETASDTKPLLEKIFRLAHNLKGGASAVGFGEVAEFTHHLETMVLKIQKGQIPLCSEVITTLLKSNDRLVLMAQGLKADINATFDNTDVLKDILTWNEVSPIAPSTPTLVTAATIDTEALPAPSASCFDEASVENINTIPAEIQSNIKPHNPAAKVTEVKAKEDEIIRVSLSRIELLNDYVGELIVLQSVVQQQSISGNVLKLTASIRQMAKLSKDIQALSMNLRMLPVKPLIQKLQRVIRDTAKTLGKEVNFEVVGDQLDIDKSVIDQLADPLIHILRNAVDHGLEIPSQRLKAGKTSFGTIRLKLQNEGNNLAVEISDDGKGIDGEILRQKATEKGILTEGQILTDKQLVGLIFHPGFSTKSVTSEISGRGVGMDIVKTTIEKIGGQIDISTEINKGSVFKLQIPLSLAVIEGIVVTTSHNRYVIPLSQIQETIHLKSHKYFPDKLGIGACIELRSQVLPLFSLEEALGGAKDPIKPDATALIINVGDQQISLAVHEVIQSQQIVIKPLDNGIVAQKGWIGTCVLGDGLPTLIISPIDLLRGRILNSRADVPSSSLLGGVPA